MKKCPACNYGNRNDAGTCKSCGERLPDAVVPKAEFKSSWPHQCAFRDGERQCLRPPEWRQAGDMAYCRYHSGSHSHKVNTQILDDLLQNGAPRKPNWRDFYVDMMIRGVKLNEAKRMYSEKYEHIKEP